MAADPARDLLRSVHPYSRATQAERRRFVRRQAALAGRLLADAAVTDDPDDLAALVCTASSELGHAVVEIMRSHLGSAA